MNKENKLSKNTKKIVILLLSIALIFGCLAVIIHFATRVTNESYEKCILGDVNGDGKIDSADALCVVKHVSKIEELFDTQQKNGDVNADGKLDTNDTLILLKYSVGDVKKLPLKQSEETTFNKTIEDTLGKKLLFEKDSLKVSAQIINSWDNSDGTKSYQIMFIATNSAKSAIESWSIKTDLDEEPGELTREWDCTTQMNGKTVTVEGNSIPADASVSCGFIVKSNKEIIIDKVYSE
ncbi:MAG: cellulose binding domain-containing protein [Ruminococcus sp.]|nr:cellulose binding domain-containing protein [Candidatus Copronaster equi]